MKNTKEVAEANRQALLDAARDVFYEVGYAAARLSDIAERVGMTRGAIYWHFKSKADVYRAIVTEISTPEALKKMLECYHHSSDVFRVLNLLIDITIDDDFEELLLSHKLVAIHLDTWLRESSHGEGKADQYAQYWARILETHTQLLEKGQTEGVVRQDIDPYTAARLFYSALFGHAMLFRKWFDHDREGKQMRKMMRIQLVDSLRP